MSICINPNCQNSQNQDTLLFCQSCGSELLLDGRYRVMRQLGGGGFGKTYEVNDWVPHTLGKPQNSVKVLKVLAHNHPKYVELFQREVQFLARFNHPGIPKVEADSYFTFKPHGYPEPLHCLVMEKIEGLDLKEYISRRGTGITQKQAMQWLFQLVAILGKIHAENFFHRDIKPSNIMLRSDGQLVLIDFGTAREVTNTYMSKQSAGQVTELFSAGYSPLEQLNGQAVPQSDFFALGRTFVYLLTGKAPSEFYDSYIDELKWRSAVPSLSPQFGEFLDRLMARLPSQRPQSAEIILQQLERLYQTLSQTEGSGTLKVTLPASSTKAHSQKLETDAASANTIHQTEASSSYQAPTSATVQTPANSSSPVSPSGDPLLESSFIYRCQQELAEFIGPMASIICQRTLSKNPKMSAAEFVAALAKTIPNPQESQAFQKRLIGR